MGNKWNIALHPHSQIIATNGGNIFNNQKEQTFNLNYSVSNYGSDINIENNLTITSGLPSPLTKDDGNPTPMPSPTGIFIHGSSLNANGNITLNSASDVSITSAEDVKIHLNQKTIKERDITALVLSVGVATAAAVATGGTGAAVIMAGAGAGFMGGLGYEKGKVTTQTTTNTSQVSSNVTSNNLEINSNNDFNLSSSNLTVGNDLTINSKEFNITDASNTAIFKEDTEKYHVNYGSLAIKSAIKGALAGFMVQDSVRGPLGLDKAGVTGANISNNSFLAGKNSYLNAIDKFVQQTHVLGAVSTPTSILTSEVVKPILGYTRGWETSNYTKDNGNVISSELVESNINIGNNIKINLLKDE